jgi:hypothetical protein
MQSPGMLLPSPQKQEYHVPHPIGMFNDDQNFDNDMMNFDLNFTPPDFLSHQATPNAPAKLQTEREEPVTHTTLWQDAPPPTNNEDFQFLNSTITCPGEADQDMSDIDEAPKPSSCLDVAGHSLSENSDYVRQITLQGNTRMPPDYTVEERSPDDLVWKITNTERTSFVGMIFIIQQALSLSDACLHRAVRIMDNFFAVQIVGPHYCKFAVMGAMRLAVQLEMTKDKQQAHSQFGAWRALMPDFEILQAKKTELYMLIKLDWHIMMPTLHTVLLELSEFWQGDTEVGLTIDYILDEVILWTDFMTDSPVVLCVACVVSAYKHVTPKPIASRDTSDAILAKLLAFTRCDGGPRMRQLLHKINEMLLTLRQHISAQQTHPVLQELQPYQMVYNKHMRRLQTFHSGAELGQTKTNAAHHNANTLGPAGTSIAFTHTL